MQQKSISVLKVRNNNWSDELTKARKAGQEEEQQHDHSCKETILVI